MKFAIYGDSFVDGVDRNSQTWAAQLAVKMGATSIDYHGRGGSSFYWTYQQILDTADQYDHIIVAVTEPVRFPVTVENHFITGPPSVNLVSSLKSQTYLLGWFMISDFDYLATVQNLMINDIKQRFPRSRFIACFPNSFTSDFNLLHINLLAKKILGVDSVDTTILGEKPAMLCHIPQPWHTVLADYLYNTAEPNVADCTAELFPPLGSSSLYYNIRR